MQLLLWAQNNLYLSVPILIVLIFISRETLFFRIKRYYLVYYALLFPGVVIHEFSHLLACWLTGAKIKDVEFFSASGGHVTHSKPRLKYVGMFLISLFPLLVGIALIFLLLPVLTATLNGPLAVFLKVIVFYLLTTVIITMFPSTKDFTNALFAYTLLIPVTLLSLYVLRSLITFGSGIVSFLLLCVGILIAANLAVALITSITRNNKALIKKKRSI